MPPSVRGQAEAGAWLWDVNANWHTNLEASGAVRVSGPDQSGTPIRPVLALVADRLPAMRTAGRQDPSKRPWAVREVRESRLSLSISFSIALHRLSRLDVERVSTWCFGLVGEQELLPACPVPALVLTKNERDNSVPAVFAPLELTAERTRDKVSDTEGKAVDVHVSFWAGPPDPSRVWS